MSLHRLLYRSEIDPGPEGDARIADILRSATRNNRIAGIGGALLATGGLVIQILEGPGGPLETTFERICCDLRHRNVKLLEFSPIARREFPEVGLCQIPVSDEARLLAHALRTGSDGLSEAAVTDAALQLLRTLVITGASTRAHPWPASRRA